MKEPISDGIAQYTGSPVAEVVEASSTEFTALSHKLYGAPPLGALVRSGGGGAVYGVVGEITTQSVDPGRRPAAMGAQEESVEEVYRNNPQLERLYSTVFRNVAVGHRADGQLVRYLPPSPPMIHQHIFRCGSDEVRDFSSSLEFIPALLRAPFGSQDDVVAAFLRQASESHDQPNTYLVDAGRVLAELLAGQLQRLNGLLRRLSW